MARITIIVHAGRQRPTHAHGRTLTETINDHIKKWHDMDVNFDDEFDGGLVKQYLHNHDRNFY